MMLRPYCELVLVFVDATLRGELLDRLYVSYAHAFSFPILIGGLIDEDDDEDGVGDGDGGQQASHWLQNSLEELNTEADLRPQHLIIAPSIICNLAICKT